jgi:hypothetical protein
VSGSARANQETSAHRLRVESEHVTDVDELKGFSMREEVKPCYPIMIMNTPMAARVADTCPRIATVTE